MQHRPHRDQTRLRRGHILRGEFLLGRALISYALWRFAGVRFGVKSGLHSPTLQRVGDFGWQFALALLAGRWHFDPRVLRHAPLGVLRIGEGGIRKIANTDPDQSMVEVAIPEYLAIARRADVEFDLAPGVGSSPPRRVRTSNRDHACLGPIAIVSERASAPALALQAATYSGGTRFACYGNRQLAARTSCCSSHRSPLPLPDVA